MTTTFSGGKDFAFLSVFAFRASMALLQAPNFVDGWLGCGERTEINKRQRLDFQASTRLDLPARQSAMIVDGLRPTISRNTTKAGDPTWPASATSHR